MVMRKFRKSLDNGAAPSLAGGATNGGDLEDLSPSAAVNSPRAPRKSKGPSLPDGLNDDAQAATAAVGSPATNRRRRSRNPNEETDGSLMDFLQQGNKERLAVAGALVFHLSLSSSTMLDKRNMSRSKKHFIPQFPAALTRNGGLVLVGALTAPLKSLCRNFGHRSIGTY